MCGGRNQYVAICACKVFGVGHTECMRTVFARFVHPVSCWLAPCEDCDPQCFCIGILGMRLRLGRRCTWACQEGEQTEPTEPDYC